MNETIRNIAPLFDDMDMRIKGFKKDTYKELFTSYREKNCVFFEELNRLLAAEDCSFMEELADSIVAYAAEMLDKAVNKAKRETIQVNLNMFVAIYFMPSILEGRQLRAEELVETICRKWASAFKGSNIKSADFSTIQSGFKSKLCYVTTAVCESLNKPENCYELRLLKDYRDNYLVQTENGEELVRRYYDIAPTIVKRIDKSGNPKEKYRYIWEKYLKPCIVYIENGEKEECGETYICMMEELQKQYLTQEDVE